MCFKPVKSNYLGEVTKLCHGCIDEQVVGFNKFKRKGDGTGKVGKGNAQEEETKWNPGAAERGLVGVGEAKLALMKPPSSGVKRVNMVRGRRESGIRAMRGISAMRVHSSVSR